MENAGPLVTNDAVVLGLLALILGGVFWTQQSRHPFFQRFYTYVPGLLLCYFLPSLLNTFNIIDGSQSRLYYVSSRFLLPACLVLLTLSIDLPAVARLGRKAVIMFFTGTAGIIIGGPLALLVVGMISPATVGGEGPEAVWRGMTTIAGSWIGGGANQAAMKEVFEVGDNLFGQMIAVDVLCASLWMAVLLFLAGRAKKIDERTGADTTAIEDLKRRIEAYHAKHARIPRLADLMFLAAVGFGATAVAHAGADFLAPWFASNMPAAGALQPDQRLLLAGGDRHHRRALLLSFTRARKLEGVGASTVGSAFLYILVASIGMQMDITAVLSNPGLFAVGMMWIGFHAALLLIVGKLIKAPLFYLAVGSQANVGGAASAPVVASAFHPSLAPVGVLLAVLGYAVGTYGAWLCGQILRVIAAG
jgi:uncharacterized membrane protein